jgi:hypothetical protein
MSLEQAMMEIENIHDVKRLRSMLSEAKVKTVRELLEQRIAVILRKAPQAGACIGSEMRQLEVVLDEAEALKVAGDAVVMAREIQGRIDALRAEVKEQGKLLAVQEERRDLAIEKQAEVREVEVVRLLDGDTVREVRTDTQEVLNIRQPYPSEIQEGLPFDAEPAERRAL